MIIAEAYSPLPLRVLLVEDDDDQRALYQHYFAQVDDFVVVGEARDGLEGVTAARHHRPQLVLLDMLMPVMDGLVALPLIKAASPTSHVVMLSSLPGAQVATAAREAGADAFIPKGTSVTTLLEQLRHIVRRPHA